MSRQPKSNITPLKKLNVTTNDELNNDEMDLIDYHRISHSSPGAGPKEILFVNFYS